MPTRGAVTVKRDRATIAAQAFLLYRVCECGGWITDHTDKSVEHLKLDLWIPDVFGMPKVKCKRFRPVRFIVKRVKP